MSSKVIFDRTLEQALQRQRLRSTLPAQIADHQLLRPIAFGSYGDVWLGRNLLTGTFRAIKIIWRGAFDNTKPYEREFEGIRRFEPISRQHPGFVHILQTGLLGNGFYYIMELADDLHTGQKIEPGSYEASTLAGLPVAHLQHFSPENAIRIGIDLARSLEVLHGAGLIHRDIKPSNVIFINGQPKLGDIGLITVASDTNSAVGTYGFMAPEGPTNARSDIYSLGKLLYEIATGKDRLEFPNLPPGVSATEGLFAELNQVVTRACEPNPLNRYSSVRALQEELEFLLQGRSVKRIRQLEKALRWTQTSFGATMAVCAIAFVVFQSIQTKRTLAAKERERKIITALARGNERVEKGDFLAALTPFARAALMDSTPSEEDALRLGSTLAYAPKLLRTWKMEAESSALSDDGTLLAAHAGPTIQVSDPVTGQVLRGIKDVALHSRVLGFNSEGNVLITAASNVLTFHSLRFGSEYQVPLNESARFFSRSRHGDLAITSSAGRVTLFPGKETLSGAGPVLKAFYSPSGHYIALIWGRGDGAIWDNLTKEFLPWAIRHADVIYNVFFTPNEERVLTMSFDRTARAWNMKTGEQAGFVMPHEDGVVFASQSPDDETLATASFDRTVKLWNASTYSPKAQNNILYHSAPLAWARFINSDLLLTHCQDGTTCLWSITPKPELCREVPRTITLPAKGEFRNGETRLTATNGQVTGKIAGKTFAVLLADPVETISVNPKQTIVAIGTRDNGFAPHSVHLFNASGLELSASARHRDGITFVTFSHSGELFVSCSEDFTARVWNLKGQPVTGPLRHKDQVRWAAFDENDEWLATGSWDYTVRVWNAHTGVAVTPPLFVDNLADWVSFHGNSEILVANEKRNYVVTLPFFRGDPAGLLESIPAPVELDER